MPGVAKFDHFGLCAPREAYDATLEFYENAFGWRRFERQLSQDFDYRILFLSDGQGGSLEVFEVEHEPVGGRHHIALAVPLERFEEVRARVIATGVETTEPVTTRANNTYIFITDPGGNRVQLTGRPSGQEIPAWTEET
jgi:predicted enzyme related to lactoylglutathione lyase